MFLNAVIVFSAVSFLVFGLSCLFSDFMVLEFKRYQLSKYRVVTGVLQLIGSAGLLVGFKWMPIAILSAAGLSLLMLLGFITRIRIKDSFLQSFPSFFYMVLNLVITFLLKSQL